MLSGLEAKRRTLGMAPQGKTRMRKALIVVMLALAIFALALAAYLYSRPLPGLHQAIRR